MKKILIVNLGGVGDLLLAQPLVRALADRYPQAKVSLLVTSAAAAAARQLTPLAELIPFKVRGKILARLADNLKVIRALRRRQFDVAVNLRTLTSGWGALKMAVLFWAIKPKQKAGRDTDGRGFFLDIKVPESYRGRKHEIDYNQDMARRLGVERVEEEISLAITQQDEDLIEGFLAHSGVKQNDVLIGLHPGGGAPSQLWPLARFAQVADNLSRQLNCRIVVTGSLEELPLLKQLEPLMEQKPLDAITPNFSIASLAALIKQCNLYITNDSGPMHIAAVVKTPLVAIFGPGDLAHYDPRRIHPGALVLHKGAECSPCNKVNCRSLRCLRAIGVAKVLRAALRLLMISG